ncbi:Tyrosine-protein kinase Src42A [Pelomyxa schiedti]|nr:Tyrosine-protein kinase Src42A [Pelomyxa schiedti]
MGKSIVQVACGGAHSVVMTSTGELLSFGDPSQGKLGRPEKDNPRQPGAIPLSTKAKPMWIAAGAIHTVIVADNGEIKFFGSKSLVPRPPSKTKETLQTPAVKSGTSCRGVACGALHTLVNYEGCVFSCGDNSNNQLGHSTNAPMVDQLQAIPFLLSISIICIAAGGSHSLACDDHGRAFAWGSGKFGQLGLGDNNSRNEPTLITHITQPISSVAAGDYHSLFLLREGCIYACGLGKCGQLGIGSTSSLSIPAALHHPTRVILIAAGGGYGTSHSAALDENHEVFTWGSNKFGQLGYETESNSDQLLPRRVHTLSGKMVKQVACGWNHTLACAELPEETGISAQATMLPEDRNCAAPTDRKSPLSQSLDPHRSGSDYSPPSHNSGSSLPLVHCHDTISPVCDVASSTRNEPRLPDSSFQLTEVQIIGVLGEGAFGTVWQGLWQGTTPVALKELKANDSVAFLNEVHLLTQLRHPNVVAYFGIYRQVDRIFMCTELIPGGNLLSYLRQHGPSLSVYDLCIIGKEAAAGMVYLSSRGVVHRDIAARNLLVKQEVHGFNIKVADFGLSVLGQHSRQTQATFPLKWTAPEAIDNGIFTSFSDVWSFGVTLWEIFTLGEEPYSRFRTAEVLEHLRPPECYRLPCPNLLQSSPSSPSPSPSHTIYNLMLSCWDSKPASRPSFSIIFDTLNAFLLSLATTTSPTPVITTATTATTSTHYDSNYTSKEPYSSYSS